MADLLNPLPICTTDPKIFGESWLDGKLGNHAMQPRHPKNSRSPLKTIKNSDPLRRDNCLLTRLSLWEFDRPFLKRSALRSFVKIELDMVLHSTIIYFDIVSLN